jgi:hypothetical protein
MDKKTLSKTIYEMVIAPEVNTFDYGEKVNIRDCFNNTGVGYIENFNADGTLFIKTDIIDMGRDYDRNFVSKIK